MTEQRHIFLSYRSVEVDFALKLAADLKNAGVNLWIDRLDIKPGDDWRRALQSAVNECTAMISVITPEYVTSRYCQRELARADRMGRPIFPILLRPLAATDWPFEIERQQYIDFSGWRDETVYREQLARLVTILKAHFGGQFSHIPDRETQYLTRLIAELEASKSVMEFIELSAQADRLLTDEITRPQPRFAEAWTMQGAFSVSEDAPETAIFHTVRQPDIPLNGIREAVEKYPRFVLIGAPGAGKTTTLHQLALSAAHARRNKVKGAPLPFLLKLTKWSDGQTPEGLIRAYWPLEGDPVEQLLSGNVALYLDGLNEMGPSGAAKAQQLREWLHGPNAPRRVIVTCRAGDYLDELNLHLPTVRAAEMDKTRIEQFVRNYIGDEAAPLLLGRILPHDEQTGENARHLFQLARNPFLLSVLVLVFMRSPDRELPQNKGTLLKQLAAELWHQENMRQTEETRSFEALEAALARLAFAMIDEDAPVYVPRAYALQYLVNDQLLQSAISARFLEEEGETVRFSHQLMQEYFAALGLARIGLPTRLSQPRFDGHGRRLANKWDPVIIALCGIAPNADVIVRAVAEVDPYLALDCIASGVEVSESTRNQTVNELLRVARDRDEDGRLSAGKTLASMQHEAGFPVLLSIMRDGPWESRQEALTVLSEIPAPEIPGLEQALVELDPEMREATATALRQIGHRAIPVLLRFLRDPNWALRRGAAWAMGELRDQAGVPALVQALQDEDKLVGAEAAIALGWIRDTSAVPHLLDALRHGNWRVRRSAAASLGWIGTSAVTGLIDALRDEDEEIRWLAVDALRNISDEAVLPALLEASYDRSIEVRSAAVEALQSTEDAKAVNRLIELLTDTGVARWAKKRVCDIAATVLEAIGTRDALAAVERWRHGEPRESRPAATGAATGKSRGKAILSGKTASDGKRRLAQITKGTGKAQAPLAGDDFKDLTAADWMVRRNAVRRLAGVDPMIALPKLMNALKDDDNQVRLAAVQVLATLKSDVAVEGLLAALGDQDSLVCDAASVALAVLGKPVIPGLIKALASKNTNMRGASIEALGKIGDKSTVRDLIPLLKDTAQPWLQEQRICDIAARALLSIGTPEARNAVKQWRASPLGASFTEKPKPAAKTQPADEETQPQPARPPHSDPLLDLLDTLHDGEWGKREAAAKQLRTYAMGLRNASNALDLQRLIGAVQDEDWVVRWAAAEALAWAGDKSAVPVLIERVNDENWTVRIAAVRGLLELGDTRAVPALIDAAADDNSNVREAAAEALGGLGDRAAIPTLITLLEDEERFVRFAAVEALGKLGDSGAVPALAKALDDEDTHVRWVAAEALGRLKDPAAVDDLVRRLDDTAGPDWEDKLVCDIVAEALENIGTPAAKQAVSDWRQKRSTQGAATS